VNSHPRKIFLAANTSWYAFNFRARLVARLVADGHEVVVVAPRDRYSDKLLELGARHIHLELHNEGTNPLSDAATLLRLCLLFRRERPDVVLTFTPKLNIYGALAGWLTRRPVVSNVSGLGSGFLRGGWIARLMVLLYRVSLRRAQWVFFQNDEDRALFATYGIVDQQKAERLPGSGVDVQRFVPTRADEQTRPFTFLFVGRLLWDKGIGEFVEAARSLRSETGKAQFLIIGNATAKNITAVPADIVEQWKEEGIVQYLGPSDDMVRDYGRADCVVLPSYREGTSRVLLEAASMGLPLITTDVPGCRNVVTDDVNGYLCRPRDASDLAEKMRRMMRATTERRREMGGAGRARVLAHFDERRVTERYLEVVAVVTSTAQREQATLQLSRQSRDTA
jgi:glycosyltransferase involved in cell wall biosynthesis